MCWKSTELVIISQVSRKVTHISVCTDYTSGPADHILSSVRFQLELSVPGSGKCDAVSVKMNLVTSQPLPVTRERLVYDGECLSVPSSHMCHNRCRHLSPSEGSPRWLSSLLSLVSRKFWTWPDSGSWIWLSGHGRGEPSLRYINISQSDCVLHSTLRHKISDSEVSVQLRNKVTCYRKL